MLELQNICYRVSTPDGEQDILKNVSITIPDHKLVVFTGPNGGGKTTLAKVIMGLVQPTSGRVLYNGEDQFFLLTLQIYLSDFFFAFR